jgi:phosphatidylserine decarboxylase
MRIAPEGYHIILAGITLLIIFAALLLASGERLFVYPFLAALIFSGFSLFFFRDPKRLPPQIQNVVLAPADGKIIALDNRIPAYFEGYASRLSIFLSMLDVHINRLPINGRVERIEYHRGKFTPAFKEKASELNEHTIIELSGERGRIGFCQRAGTIARRIVCNLKVNDNAIQGERFGMIRFGSRVDVYLPENVLIKASRGQHVRAGETIIAEFTENES